MKTKLKLALIVLTISFGCTNAQVNKVITAEKIFNNYVKAIGGQNAIDKIDNQRSQSELTIKAANIVIKREVILTKENKFYSIATAPQIGEIKRGFDGVEFWEQTTMSGTRTFNNEEKAMALEGTTLFKYARWKDTLKSTLLLSESLVDENPNYEIEITSAYGNKEILSIDKRSFLLKKVTSFVKANGQEIKTITEFDDYKKVDNLLISHKHRISLPGQKRELTFKSIEHNIDVDKRLFEIIKD